MSASDWIAIAALVVAAGSLVYGRVSARASKDSARSGRDSADAAKISAEASRIAAEASAGLTAIEADRRQEERRRFHHEHRPLPVPAEFRATVRKAMGKESWHTELIVQGNYRFAAVGIFSTGGETTLASGVLRANQPYDLHIEPIPPGAAEMKINKIKLKFWPTIEGDEGADPWECPCGAPLDSFSGDGHWTWTIPVDKPGVHFRAL